MEKKLSTESYKGTRDFYPEDMAIQRYIFDTWAKTAELFGFERYDASILEPSELYKSKGAENEEMVNEQTYTFIDRGDREVTLRPEMTPTVARMIAGKRRDLKFPVRWYSIPNLFRYERPQRGRLREHWQLNCDVFGADHYSVDVEMIALAYNVLKAFGAKDSDFEIRINDRNVFSEILSKLAKNADSEITDLQKREVIRLSDKLTKISKQDFNSKLNDIVGPKVGLSISEVVHSKGMVTAMLPEIKAFKKLQGVYDALQTLKIKNVRLDASLARGFDYYTGTIFEIFDTDSKNNRSLIGGGRYDNLTSLFGGDPVSGVGFGLGDVTMRDFLETHNLLEGKIPSTAPVLMILPMDASQNFEAEKIAMAFRKANIRTAVDLSDKKIGKKISQADEVGVSYILVVGTDEISSQIFTLKALATKSETKGTISELITSLI